MRLFKHNNLVGFVEFIQEPKIQRNSIIMEYCDAGDLLTFVKDRHYLSIDEIKFLMKGINDGLNCMWVMKHMAHRDIKLENILLATDPKLRNLKKPYCLIPKIADYGMARTVTNDDMKTTVGTPLFASPQILMNNKYTLKADLYSIGVVLFVMAFGRYPFTAEPDTFWKAMQSHAPPAIPESAQNDPKYAQLVDLIKGLIVYDEEHRMSVDQYFAHPFFQAQTSQKASQPH